MIRKAETEELNRILEIYQIARKFMMDHGNPTQWGTEHPSKELLENDLKQGNLYVITENNIVHGVFAFVIGEDETYSKIDGGWKNSSPYGTIHRIAGDGIGKGIFAQCLEFCLKKIGHLRIDTHQNNLLMQHLIEKNGFERCGIIYVRDGSPRIAYELMK